MVYDPNRWAKFAAEASANDTYKPRPQARIPITLQTIALYWQKHPDLRLGQLLMNIDIDYNTEDEVIIDRLNLLLSNEAKR